MDIVDSQVHIGPGGIAEMVAAMDALGIASVLNDEYWIGTAGDPGYRIDERVFRPTNPTAELAAWTYPGRFSYLVRVEPHDPELRSIIRQTRDATYARALRVSPGMTRAEIASFADGAYDEVFAGAADAGLPVFVQISGNTELLARYLERYPELRIIICHTGMPIGPKLVNAFAGLEGLPDSLEHWTKVASVPLDQSLDEVLRIARFPNVALKWAHAPTMFGASPFPSPDLRPWFRRTLDAFGAERVMWASDISANQSGESWAELMFWIRDNPDLSEGEKALVLGGTARTWLDWPS